MTGEADFGTRRGNENLSWNLKCLAPRPGPSRRGSLLPRGSAAGRPAGARRRLSADAGHRAPCSAPPQAARGAGRLRRGCKETWRGAACQRRVRQVWAGEVRMAANSVKSSLFSSSRSASPGPTGASSRRSEGASWRALGAGEGSGDRPPATHSFECAAGVIVVRRTCPRASALAAALNLVTSRPPRAAAGVISVISLSCALEADPRSIAGAASRSDQQTQYSLPLPLSLRQRGASAAACRPWRAAGA